MQVRVTEADDKVLGNEAALRIENIIKEHYYLS